MVAQLECDLKIDVLTSCDHQFPLPSHEVDELVVECDTVSQVNPGSPDFKDGKVVTLLEKLVTTGERLLACHGKWSESVKRGVCNLDPVFENEIKDLFKKYKDTCDLTIKYIESLGVEKKEIYKKMDFGIVICKIAKIYCDWKTPTLYILPSMRRQVITGVGAEKVRKMLEKSRAQKAS